MATSQNGWEVIPTGTDSRLTAIPKIAGRVRAGAVAQIFTYLVERFDSEVEDIDLGKDDWGYANRNVRGGRSISNHASGTALDINAEKHYLGARGTFSAAQRAAIRRILADINQGKRIIRWGGDYRGRADEMHFEIIASPAEAAVAAAGLPRAKSGIPSLADWPLARRTLSVAAVMASVSRGIATESMQSLQAILGNLVTDGVWGPKTKARYAAVVSAKGYPRARDGRPLESAIRRLAAGRVAKVQ